MNKKFVCLLVLALLALSAFAREFHHGHHHHHHQHHLPDGTIRAEHPENQRIQEFRKRMAIPTIDKEDRKIEMVHHHHHHKFDRHMKELKKGSTEFMTTLYPNVTYTEPIETYARIYSIPYSKGDSIAVQIVRASDMYAFKKPPTLYRCSYNSGKKCQNDKMNNSLSFEISADELAKRWSNTFEFTLYTAGVKSGVSVGLYVCVGKNASLATCYAPCTKKCVYGHQSDVMNVCICNKNYTGSNCSQRIGPAPAYFSSEFDEILDGIACVISFVLMVIFVFVIISIIGACCACLRICCAHHRRQRRCGRVVNGNPLPPPPAYAYHPLGTAPPPPPPPMPGQYYDVQSGNAIEMSTLPVARNANPVYIMPPLAPVKQVPVFVQPPPAPKN